MSKLMSKIPLRVQAATVRATYALPKALRRAIVGAPIRIDGQELALDAQLLLVLEKLAGFKLADGTPVQARERLAASKALITGPPIEPVSVRGLTIENDIPARFYTPDGLGDDVPLLVFYHGGGWVVGSLDSHDNLCRFLAIEAGVKVLSVDYRLAPEHRFPAAADDALAAFHWAVKNAAELGIDPERIAVGGDSAGGNLAAVTAHQAVQAGGPKPVFQLLFYPAVDASVRRESRELFAEGFFLTSDDMDWFSDHYCPDLAERSDPRFSVLLAEDLTNMPPAYVATAGFDPLRDEGEAYAEKLKASGVPTIARRHPDLIHGYATFISVGTRFKEATAEAATTLKAALALT
ncbi:alpha/beta hydrolase [Actinokineospora sp.]|uniref:alpha/beta hydrolase n=1 Tax=Actinokineospora sp. TaxID=1872133 RepID=UPI003D6C04C2